MTHTHSPTPWAIRYGRIFDANDEKIAILEKWQDGEFIVTAVNAYEANQEKYENLHKSFTEAMIEISEQQALINQLVSVCEDIKGFLKRSGYDTALVRSALSAAKEAGF